MKTFVIIVFILITVSLEAFPQKNFMVVDTTRAIALKEVIIQAEKSDEKLQKIPASASLISQQRIQVQEIQALTDLSARIPNFFIPDYGTRLTTPVYIRGIGSRIGAPSVGLYVDNIPYFDRGSFNFQFLDLKKIEVLRGPQGTLYGRNTMGGLIKIYTTDPTNKQEGDLRVNYGNDNQIHTMFRFNQPVSKKMQVLLDGSFLHRDGFFTNTFNNKKADGLNTWSGRIKMAYHASRKMKIICSADYEKNDQNGYPYGLYNDSLQTGNPVNYNQPSAYNRDLFSSGLNVNYIGNRFIVSTATSYQYLNDHQRIDQDFLPVSLFYVRQDRIHHTVAQEFTIHSKNNVRLQWLAGAFGFLRFKNKQVGVDFDGIYNTRYHLQNKNKTYNQPTKGAAIYGQVSYPFWKFTVTGGLRMDYEVSRLAYNYDLVLTTSDTIHTNFDHHLQFTQILPKITVSFPLKENINTYVAVTRGYKTGGFNSTFERKEDQTYAPEYSINYETGIKSSLYHNRVKANLCLFYIDWRNQQVYQPIPSGQGAMLKNAGHSISRGVEIELLAMVHKNLEVWTSFGYNHAQYLHYKKDSLHIYDGNHLVYIPSFTLNAGFDYSIYLSNTSPIKKILLNMNYQRLGRMYWNDSNTAYQDDYGLLNGRLSFEAKKMAVGLWSKNMLNARYYSFYFEELGNAYVQQGTPFQIGLFIQKKF